MSTTLPLGPLSEMVRVFFSIATTCAESSAAAVALALPGTLVTTAPPFISGFWVCAAAGSAASTAIATGTRIMRMVFSL